MTGPVTIIEGEALDDWLDEISKQRRAAAHAKTYAFQEALGSGDFFARYDMGNDVMIFGVVLKATDKEDERLLARTPWLRLARCFSVMCPQGEIGDVHLCDLIPLEPSEFVQAGDSGWRDHNVVIRALQRVQLREFRTVKEN